VDVVAGMVGLHAQVMSSAELQAAARIDELRPADVRDALWERRSLVKVWAFRQTLHLLTADDLAEFVVAARSLERWHTPAWLRYFNMTEAGVTEVIEAIGDALGGRPMTRVEVVDAVVERVRRPHLRDDMLTGWGTFLGPAAQRGRLVFGPSEGRNVAFVNPSDWLDRPIASPADHDAVHRVAGWVTPIIVVDGRVAGTWEIENGKGGAGVVVVQPFRRWRGGVRRELDREVDRIGAFLDRPLRLAVGSVG
jgi:Winged helix DNA-binding domain